MVSKNKQSHSPKEVLKILRNSSKGRTITELTEISQLSRSAVRIALARLEGSEEVKYRNIGMAKVYTLQ